MLMLAELELRVEAPPLMLDINVVLQDAVGVLTTVDFAKPSGSGGQRTRPTGGLEAQIVPPHSYGRGELLGYAARDSQLCCRNLSLQVG